MLKKYREFTKIGVFLAWDVLAINVSFFLAYFIRFRLQFFLAKPFYPFEFYANFLIFVNVVTIMALSLFGLYRFRKGGLWVDELFAVAKAVIVAALILMASTFLTEGYRYGYLYSRLLIFIFWCLSIPLLTSGRLILTRFYQRQAIRKLVLERVVIVGSGRTAQMARDGLNKHPELGYEFVGFIEEKDSGTRSFYGSPVLGSLTNLLEIARRENIHEVIFTEIDFPHQKQADLIIACQRQGVNVRVVSDFYEIITSSARIEEFTGIPAISFRRDPLYGFNLALKRAEDIILSTLGLVLLSPFMLTTALFIKITTPGSVFFNRERVGKDGKGFIMYKFRTMVRDAEERREELQGASEVDPPLFKMRRDPRVTRIGSFFRRYSVDELPQLVNVIKGEMSLVGPRPSLPSEVEKYKGWHKKRLEVLPGITGLWQASGRSDLTFSEMVRLDIYYMRNWSLTLDLKILFRTLPIVLARRGAY